MECSIAQEVAASDVVTHNPKPNYENSINYLVVIS